MTGKAKSPEGGTVVAYREQSIHFPIAVMVVALLLVCAPSLFWIHRVNVQGNSENSVVHYHALLDLVATDILAVDALMRDDASALAALDATRKAPVVRLIVPDVVIVEEKKVPEKEVSPLRSVLEAIYWNKTNPLATLDGETYRVGDSLQGYEIVAINKSTVLFKGGDGKVVVKDIDEDLRKYRR